jgi:hypothetical protein
MVFFLTSTGREGYAIPFDVPNGTKGCLQKIDRGYSAISRIKLACTVPTLTPKRSASARMLMPPARLHEKSADHNTDVSAPF